MASQAITGNGNRVDWVDYAKGFCIIFVVMMHSTLGVESDRARASCSGSSPLPNRSRMPDFFLISGLFLARVIDRDWRSYLDRKVVHFAYFYALWITIIRAEGTRLCRRARLAGRARALPVLLYRTLRHAVVHLHLADLLRRGEGRA